MVFVHIILYLLLTTSLILTMKMLREEWKLEREMAAYFVMQRAKKCGTRYKTMGGIGSMGSKSAKRLRQQLNGIHKQIVNDTKGGRDLQPWGRGKIPVSAYTTPMSCTREEYEAKWDLLFGTPEQKEKARATLERIKREREKGNE